MNYEHKFYKYRIKYENLLSQVGASASDICDITENLTDILIHGVCLDGAMTSYLLQKYCDVDPYKISYIPPGNAIISNIDQIKQINENARIGIYDLALPELPKNVLSKYNIIKIVDHHSSTEAFKDETNVDYETDHATCGIIWSKYFNDPGLTTAPYYLQVIDKGDRGILSLDIIYADDFIAYIGLQTILDTNASYRKDGWRNIAKLMNYLVDKVDRKTVQKIGVIEILRQYYYIRKYTNHCFLSYFKNNKIIYVPKKAGATVAQISGKMLRDIDYVIVYPETIAAGRLTIRGVSTNSNAVELGKEINYNDSGGHTKAASVGVDESVISNIHKNVQILEQKCIDEYSNDNNFLQKFSKPQADLLRIYVDEMVKDSKAEITIKPEPKITKEPQIRITKEPQSEVTMGSIFNISKLYLPDGEEGAIPNNVQERLNNLKINIQKILDLEIDITSFLSRENEIFSYIVEVRKIIDLSKNYNIRPDLSRYLIEKHTPPSRIPSQQDPPIYYWKPPYMQYYQESTGQSPYMQDYPESTYQPPHMQYYQESTGYPIGQSPYMQDYPESTGSIYQQTGQPAHMQYYYPESTYQPPMQYYPKSTGYPQMGQLISQPTGYSIYQPMDQFMYQPTGQSTDQPISQPTGQSTGQPISQQIRQPISQPTRQPPSKPTSQPRRQPTSQPTRQPTPKPTRQPLSKPTSQPTRQPTSQPSSKPTSQPSRQPPPKPTHQPTSQPTRKPTYQPTYQPTRQTTSKSTRQ